MIHSYFIWNLNHTCTQKVLSLKHLRTDICGFTNTKLIALIQPSFLCYQAPKTSSNIAIPLNKGNVYITSTSSSLVYEAYFKQFEKDFKLFLKSRSEELRSGGIMVLTFIGRDKTRKINNPAEVIGMVLNGMVQEVSN